MFDLSSPGRTHGGLPVRKRDFGSAVPASGWPVLQAFVWFGLVKYKNNCEIHECQLVLESHRLPLLQIKRVQAPIIASLSLIVDDLLSGWMFGTQRAAKPPSCIELPDNTAVITPLTPQHIPCYPARRRPDRPAPPAPPTIQSLSRPESCFSIPLFILGLLYVNKSTN